MVVVQRKPIVNQTFSARFEVQQVSARGLRRLRGHWTRLLSERSRAIKWELKQVTADSPAATSQAGCVISWLPNFTRDRGGDAGTGAGLQCAQD